MAQVRILSWVPLPRVFAGWAFSDGMDSQCTTCTVFPSSPPGDKARELCPASACNIKVKLCVHTPSYMPYFQSFYISCIAGQLFGEAFTVLIESSTYFPAAEEAYSDFFGPNPTKM